MSRVIVPQRLSAATLAGPEPASRIVVLDGSTMGTSWSVRAVVPPAFGTPPLWRAIQSRLDTLVEQMSHWDPASDLSRYNDAAAGSWHVLPMPFAAVLDAALQFAAASDGAFDPTIGALVDCWGFGATPRRRAPPDADEIAAAKARSGWQRLRYDAGQQQLHQPGGLRLDLSAIAKGYALDVVAAVLRAAGIAHYLIEIGGELYGQGCKPDGQPWWVEIEDPPEAGFAAPLRLALDGLALATSGDQRRSFEHENRRYAHTLDPRSGVPLTHTVCAVSVLHQEGLGADALATLLYVLGADAGMAYATRAGIAARFVERGAAPQATRCREHLTPALEALLQ